MKTEEEIIALHGKFMELISKDSRAEQLQVMYEDFEDALITSPASGKIHFHNCFPGGYLDHVLRVAETAVRLTKMYKEMGGIVDYTAQEVIFAALHHDLGKLGTKNHPYYVDQDSDWHRKRGEIYTHNHDIGFMTVADRAMFTLQKYGIEITENEWYGIRMADGLYDEANKKYLINYTHPNPIRTNLGKIMHMADWMSTGVENDNNEET